jgi:ATP phosphoribosyltransferase
MSSRKRLRIAVQKSGRLADSARDLLMRCGLQFSQSRDRLFCFGNGLPIDLLLVRDDDIPGLLADDVCDLGIVGRNVLAEDAFGRADASPFREWRALGFGGCRLSLAVPDEMRWDNPEQLAGRRIASSYPRLLGDWLRRNAVAAEVVTLSGSVEIAPRLGSADLICDLVSSGATLAANHLREVAVVMQSEAVLAGAATPPADERADLLDLLLRRLDGALSVRESRLVMLQAPRAALATIANLLPGRPRPTVTSIEGSPDRIAMQALCSSQLGWHELEAMRNAGARAMLVLPVEKMLA